MKSHDISLYIHCYGISHQTASVDLRETLAFSGHRLQASLAQLGCGGGADWRDFQEMVILSTCNRVEIYVLAHQPVFDRIEKFLAGIQNQSITQISPYSYCFLNKETIFHLFRVACGLESVVIGEPQILGQVTEAYSAARQQGTAGKILSRLFQAAIFTGKRARTETVISHNPASISSMAVHMISHGYNSQTASLENAKIMVLGAGEMAELAVDALRKRGAKAITVVNRTKEKAQVLADRWNGQAASLEFLVDLLVDIDIVIASTSAPHVIISSAMVQTAMAKRHQRPIVFMDIAVPRDIDVEVANLPNVTLFDMDNLTKHLASSIEKRRGEVESVEAIIEQEYIEFENYLATLDVIPLITSLRKRADTIRQNELAKSMRKFSNLTQEDQEQLDLLTQAIVKKILHSPTTRLREIAGTPDAVDYANVTRGLFGLES